MLRRASREMLPSSKPALIFSPALHFLLFLLRVAFKVGPLALRGLLLQVLPPNRELVSRVELGLMAESTSGMTITYALALYRMLLSLNSFSATLTTSSIRPAPILVSTSSTLGGADS
jgi:hypothetical protein